MCCHVTSVTASDDNQLSIYHPHIHYYLTNHQIYFHKAFALVLLGSFTCIIVLRLDSEQCRQYGIFSTCITDFLIVLNRLSPISSHHPLFKFPPRSGPRCSISANYNNSISKKPNTGAPLLAESPSLHLPRSPAPRFLSPQFQHQAASSSVFIPVNS